MLKVKLLFILMLGVISVYTANVTNIKNCPALTPREAPTSVHDLRPDDIKVIGALGDSVTAGYAMLGYKTSLPPLEATLQSYTEFRGLSYSAGGDEGAYTIPNYIKHYEPNVTGYSVGQHLAEYCEADDCIGIYSPNKDYCNAALSGSTAANLLYQVDYLIARMKVMIGHGYNEDWKMINIQIGSNDICGSCNSTFEADVTPDKFGSYVEAAVGKIYANIPNTLVNLIGTFNVSQIFPLTMNQSYCMHGAKSNLEECSCATTPGGLEKMENLTFAYNEKLVSIYNKYKQMKLDNFTVVYQQSNINISSFPLEFFSTVDCFHPSLLGHQWVSKIVWNELFLPQAYKPKVFDWNWNETIYCPVDSDRISTK